MLGQLVMAARGPEGRRSRSPAPTTRPATAPASATTSTSGTSPAPTCARSRSSTTCSRRPARRAWSSTSAPARASPCASWSPRSSRSSARPVPLSEAPPRPGDAVGAFANVDRAARAARLAHRAVARRRHRLRAGLGREAPGDPGLRVNWSSPRSWRSPCCGVCAPRRTADAPDSGPARVRAGTDPRVTTSRSPGRVVVLDPGHQLGNHNFPEEINRPVPAGGFTKPCNTTGTATDGGYAEATFAWRVTHRGSRPAREGSARAVLLTRTHQPRGPLGPVRRRPRPGRQPGQADLKISIHGDGSYAAGAHGFHVIVPARPAAVDRRHLPALDAARTGHPGGPAPRRASTTPTTSPAATASTSARPRHAQPLRRADRDGRARQHARPATTPR